MLFRFWTAWEEKDRFELCLICNKTEVFSRTWHEKNKYRSVSKYFNLIDILEYETNVVSKIGINWFIPRRRC